MAGREEHPLDREQGGMTDVQSTGWLRQTLLCRCPRCGQGRLFHGLLTTQPACSACALPLSPLTTDDGPAALVILVLGFIVVGLALWVEVKYEPPFWVHAILWTPMILAGGLFLMRAMKAWMIGQQYRHLGKTGE
jgi:uncharacterized protein (DUF983 family)